MMSTPTSPGSPFVPKAVRMDGTWIAFALNPKWVEIDIQARTAANISWSVNADGSDYNTIKSGTSLTLGADFLGETIYLQGAVDVIVEILTQTRA